MIVSLNEIETTVRKAARGLGLAVGLAEDCGRQAAWLAAAGFDAVSAILAACEGVEAGRAVAPGGTRDPSGRIAPEGGAVLSAVSAGPSLLDLVQAPPSTAAPLRAGPIDVPLLILGATACATIDARVPVTLSWGAPTVWARFDGAATSIRAAPGVDPAACRDAPVAIAARSGDLPALPEIRNERSLSVARAGVLATGVPVPVAAWEALGRLAARCLVPADARLRLVGAGAGVVDRD